MCLNIAIISYVLEKYYFRLSLRMAVRKNVIFQKMVLYYLKRVSLTSNLFHKIPLYIKKEKNQNLDNQKLLC